MARVSTIELSDQTDEIISRVADRRERVIILRDGVAVAVLQPFVSTFPTLSELSVRFAGVEWPDPEFFEELEQIRDQLNTPVEPPEWP